MLDTKYKNTPQPSNADLFQVVAYAALKNCENAALVYPISIAGNTPYPFGTVTVRAMGFPIEGDLDRSGEEFMKVLLNWLKVPGF